MTGGGAPHRDGAPRRDAAPHRDPPRRGGGAPHGDSAPRGDAAPHDDPPRRGAPVGARELHAALHAAAPSGDGARDRAWEVVRAAYAEREPVPRRPPWRRIAAAGVVTAVAAVGVATASAPDSGVGRWVRSAFDGSPDAPPARPALGAVPGGGRLLVQSGGSAWVVASDGGKRRLGAYAGASWSPHGRFVVAWRGRELTAVEPNGRVRWSRAAPRRIVLARWNRRDGFRIAYLAGAELRIVNGDGTGDRRYASARRGVAPAWRPDDDHVLAYADRRGRVAVEAVDSHRRLWRSAPRNDVVALAWSADGRRLVVATRRRVAVFSRAGRPLAERAAPAGAAIAAAATAPSGRATALVRHGNGRSDVVLLDARLHGRSLFTGPGRLGALAWSPDGRSLLVPWPEADQWLFLRAGTEGRLAAVGNVAGQFTPGASNPPFPGSVEWCCGSGG
jgi:WD40-like Beta Propeller Repeat